jgi:DNA-binding transcriptional regulator YiaG
MRSTSDSDRVNELRRLIETGSALEIRERAGWSRDSVARHLAVSGMSVKRWETGQTKPRLGDALRYLRLLRELEKRIEAQS